MIPQIGTDWVQGDSEQRRPTALQQLPLPPRLECQQRDQVQRLEEHDAQEGTKLC